MKIAFLVTFAPTIRVVVDVEDSSLERDDDFIKVVTAARKKMVHDIEDYLNGDNCTDVEPDEELPYPQSWDK